ncbi:hypothetical protein D3C73_991930 [compost metagenome]
MRWRWYAQLGFTVAGKGLKLLEGMNEMMVLPAQFTCNAQADIFSSLVFRGSISISEKIPMIRDIAVNPLETPDKVQMPHRLGILAIRKNRQTVVDFLINYSLNRFRFNLLIPLKVLVKRILDIIPVFDLLFIF